ncbi:hypothetical protein PTE30175_04107 [Pandoraea terrae]|uniref:Isoprenylcysteine carboxyl methyltransferase n=1 Tax=Pandoraea terrae TaxID=1537710 RepID=A0A5E4XZX7_9BURK|nr:isoprenylcysteine carboxylmethyltransferase family protein [Pandoraea terrae]VVE41944.1 hypothetical protein PTE30175_04107 [Pandoraea terrae]
MSKVRIVLISTLGTLAYVWLAILGAGGISAFFSRTSTVAATLVLIALTIAALFTEGNLSSGEREDRSNRWVLIVFGVLGVLSAYIPAYTDRIGFWAFGDDGVRWMGVVLLAVGGVLRIWPVFVLGNRFSGLVAIQPGHTLVTDGIYRYIRNPSYLGLLVGALGWALVFRSGAGILLAALNLPPLFARIRAEESLLRSQFGDQYDQYCEKTWRLIPGIY